MIKYKVVKKFEWFCLRVKFLLRGHEKSWINESEDLDFHQAQDHQESMAS